jgi:hypothetical protein
MENYQVATAVLSSIQKLGPAMRSIQKLGPAMRSLLQKLGPTMRSHQALTCRTKEPP